MATEQDRASPSAGDSQAATPAGAVFLSYASEDAAAAERSAMAVRSAGIEVWFDKTELRGGDAWDRQIRRQIHDCALFVPIISARSDARHEGYFRREWRLAVERAGDMAEDVRFLLPVVIDNTPDAKVRVPDRFREVQWSRLPDRDAPAAFIERVRLLLSHEAPTPQTAATTASAGLCKARPGKPAPEHRWSHTIGRTLNVSHVVEGSVRRYDDQVRITAQLVR